MEKRALVLALALTLPLALYGIPYAYAATTSSSYQVKGDFIFIPANFGTGIAHANCQNGDYATGGGFSQGGGFDILSSEATSDTNPGGWSVNAQNPSANTHLFVRADAICQTPITVAGIGVPEFGSLYVAIALGAVAYFMLSRRFGRKPTISARA
jgi:hypothetical protein